MAQIIFSQIQQALGPNFRKEGKSLFIKGNLTPTLSKLSPDEGWLLGMIKELGVLILLFKLWFCLPPVDDCDLSRACWDWTPTPDCTPKPACWSCSPCWLLPDCTSNPCCCGLRPVCLAADPCNWAAMWGGMFSVLPWLPSSNTRCLADLSYEKYERNRSLTNISLASFLWDIGKQWRPRSDAAKHGVWSGSPLFAYMNRMFYQNLNKNKKYQSTTLKTEMDSKIQHLIRVSTVCIQNFKNRNGLQPNEMQGIQVS